MDTETREVDTNGHQGQDIRTARKKGSVEPANDGEFLPLSRKSPYHRSMKNLMEDDPVKDERKTKKQLIAELDEMRRQRAVEKAAERIREEVLAMRQSEDMVNVVAVIWQKMVQLGIQTPTASIGFVDEDGDKQIMCSPLYTTPVISKNITAYYDIFLSCRAVGLPEPSLCPSALPEGNTMSCGDFR